MQVKEIMSIQPSHCTPESTIQEAAQMMVEADCGAIPVVRAHDHLHPVGIITDRDITCRAAAKGMDPRRTQVRECMSTALAVISADTPIHECCQIMEKTRVRRLMVVDDEGRLCGIVSQADIALHLPEHDTAEVVREISEPTEEPSLVG